MPAIRDPGQRAALYPRVLPLLDGLPNGLGGGTKSSKGTEGRFVRIELQGRRTFTLAEVEVFSDGRNVAPLGKATQKNTAYNGPADRAIDGNKNGSYGDGGQTHTEENTTNPWWEVDLGADYPIDSVVVWNRTEGDYYTRLNHYTLKVLDASRQVAFEAANLPAPEGAGHDRGRRDRCRGHDQARRRCGHSPRYEARRPRPSRPLPGLSAARL